MQMPSPGPQHANLAKLAGHWIGTETMFPSSWNPEQSERQGEIRARVMDGFFVISDYVQRSGDQVTFNGHGVYSWDPEKEHYVMYWFDSMGGAGGIATGRMEGNQLTFQNRSPFGHHRYRYTFGEGETRFEMAMSPDGEQWQAQMDARYRPA